MRLIERAIECAVKAVEYSLRAARFPAGREVFEAASTINRARSRDALGRAMAELQSGNRDNDPLTPGEDA